MDLPKNIRDKFRKKGSLGGKQTLRKLGTEHFRKMGKKSALNKADNKP